MMQTETVIEDVSPNGNIEAFVEQDDRVAYLYLRGAPETEFGVRSCWIRNLTAAPAEPDMSGMRRGIPPLLPRGYCVNPSGSSRLNARDLRIVWFEEGDAAALVENGKTLAVIPSWSGTDGFHGFARDCTAENPLCWPLTSDNALHERIKRSEEYWKAWDNDPSPWDEVQENQLNAYKQQLGDYEKYYGIDGGNWPPKAMIRTPYKGGLVLTTIGVCLRSQPSVETATDNPEAYRRIELGMVVGADLVNGFDRIGRYLSAQTNLPWRSYSWLGPGHTIPCDAFAGTEYTAVHLQYQPPGAPAITLPHFRSDPVKLLWAVPITEKELTRL